MKAFALIFRALVAGPARRHPLRTALPVFGVAIGVAAVAAIHHANRSVTESFREAAATLAGRSDFVVTGTVGVPIEALRSLSFLWSHGSFAPTVSGPAVLQNGSGELVSILGIDPGGDQAIRDMRLIGGGPGTSPPPPGSVFLPLDLARRHHLRAGRRLDIVAGGVASNVPIGGLLELSGVARTAASDRIVTDIFTAQRLLGKSSLDRVDIVLDPGEPRREMEQAIALRLPAGLTLSRPERPAATADRMVRAFRFNLNALGSLTLLVGLFLIANAVSISVLRRRPEIATLKALGASHATVFAVFVAEGLAIGAAGTLLGEAGGALLARTALAAVSGTVSSIYLPTARITSAGYWPAALLAAVVGLSAALVATLVPAAEAMRVPPSPGMRLGSVEAERQRRVLPRTAAALFLLAAAGGASLAPAVDGFPLFGFAAVGLIVGALALVAPLLVRAASRAAARPLARLFGAPGRLASRFFGGSLARNGIAVAALALALGMTLAMIVTVASIRETVRVWVESTLRSDLWVKAASGGSRGLVGDLSAEILPFLGEIPGIAAVDPLRVRDTTDSRGRPFTIGCGDFRVLARIGGLPFVDGRDARRAALEARQNREVLISEPFARRFGVSAKGSIRLPTPGGLKSFRVAGVYRDYSNDRGTVMLDRELYLALFGDSRVTSVAILAEPGVDTGALRRKILAASQGRFALSISTNRELRREALRIFDRTFAVTRALESIAVAVAILGVANALVASAIERRRAFGLLRAVGAGARQIRKAVLLEAALTGCAATLVSLAAAAAFAYLLLAVINPQSFGWTVVVSVPAKRLALVAGAVLAASFLAGVYPGRLAASVDPAAALAEE